MVGCELHLFQRIYKIFCISKRDRSVMELRHLRTFRAVAVNRSFTRAANELGYVQSAITSHVKALEADLGVRLFDRLGRRVILTDAGSELLAYATKILDLTDGARAAVVRGGEPSGTLRVSASETLCVYRLPPVLKTFGERAPGVRVVFEPSRNGTLDPTLRRRLSEGAVDVAFVIERERGEVGEIVSETLIREPLVLVAAPDHPLAEANEVRPGDLAGESVLMAGKGCGFREVFEEQMARAGVGPKSEIEFASGEAIKRCVEGGMGVAVLSAVSVAEEVRDGRLTVLDWSEPDFLVATQMLHHGDRWLSPALGTFLDTARDVLGVGGDAGQIGSELPAVEGAR
jgi:DNA-binding transcriptional LysR family regulator